MMMNLEVYDKCIHELIACLSIEDMYKRQAKLNKLENRIDEVILLIEKDDRFNWFLRKAFLDLKYSIVFMEFSVDVAAVYEETLMGD